MKEKKTNFPTAVEVFISILSFYRIYVMPKSNEKLCKTNVCPKAIKF